MARPRRQTEAAEGGLTAPVRLLSDHGYIEGRFNRGRYHWSSGEIITNPDEIAHLRERGAKLEPVACPELPQAKA